MSLEENKTIARRFVEGHNGPDYVAIIDELLAPGAVYHDPAVPNLPPGPEAFKQFIAGFRSAMPDISDKVEDVFAEGNKVVLRWSGTGTQTGELMGIPPTGKKVMVSGIYIIQVRDGKVAEIWNNWDTIGMLQQLGVAPAPGQ